MTSQSILSRTSKLFVSVMFLFSAVAGASLVGATDASAYKSSGTTGAKIRFYNNCGTSKHVSASWPGAGVGFYVAGYSSRTISVPQSTSIKVTTTMYRHNGTVYVPGAYTVNKMICG